MPDLSLILVVLNFGCAMVCVLAAIVGAGVLASYLTPLDPSRSKVATSHDRYVATQVRLSYIRAQRRMVADMEDVTTPRERPHTRTHNVSADLTRPVKVCEVAVAPTMCVGSPQPAMVCAPAHTVTQAPTVSDVVARALALAHMSTQRRTSTHTA